jgi:hypothetical protein
MTENDLKKIFQSVWTEIFTYNFSPENGAEVEFINADGRVLFNIFSIEKFLLF